MEKGLAINESLEKIQENGSEKGREFLETMLANVSKAVVDYINSTSEGTYNVGRGIIRNLSTGYLVLTGTITFDQYQTLKPLFAEIKNQLMQIIAELQTGNQHWSDEQNFYVMIASITIATLAATGFSAKKLIHLTAKNFKKQPESKLNPHT